MRNARNQVQIADVPMGADWIDCPACIGRGRVLCPTCGGDGCSDCKRRGSVRCEDCDGFRKVDKYTIEDDE